MAFAAGTRFGVYEITVPPLVSLIRRYAVSRNLEQIEWLE